MPSTVEIYDVNNQYSWEYVVLVFDDIYGGNQLVERWRYNDDGVEVQERFEFGQLVEFTQFDAQNAHNWEFQHIMYDPNGDMMRRETFFDNGISKTEEFFEGRLFYTVVSRKWWKFAGGVIS